MRAGERLGFRRDENAAVGRRSYRRLRSRDGAIVPMVDFQQHHGMITFILSSHHLRSAEHVVVDAVVVNE